jgi:hypothetical protein
MKKYLIGLLVTAGFAVAISSCSDDETQNGSIDDLSVEAKSFLALRAGSASTLGESRNAVINMSFQGLFTNSGSRSGRVAGDSTDIEPDTTIIWPEIPECAQVNYSEIPGGYKTTIDYGDSCDLSWGGFKYIVFGKYSQSYTSRYSQNGSKIESEYEIESEYDNYGGLYSSDSTGEHSWSMDGKSDYSGSSVWDSLNGKFSGRYEHNDETSYKYDDNAYSYFSEGSSEYDEEKWTLTTNTYRYTDGTDFYESAVLKPLVYKYSCSEIGLFAERGISASYVSGREKITYKQGDKSGSFIIDYGDGACDSIITIIENGVEIKIDLSEEWEKLNSGS